MAKTGYFVGNDAGHVVTPCERRVKAKYRRNKGKLGDVDGSIISRCTYKICVQVHLLKPFIFIIT